MSVNTFQSKRGHTRVKFEPLNVSCSLVCLTPQSPMAQVINTTLSPIEYEPDRSDTPTLILPEVRAIDLDNVFQHGAVNQYLTLDNMEWTVNGKPINSKNSGWKEGVDYEIIKTEDDTRGALKVFKNLGANEKAVLHFKGKFFDWRTGIIIDVESGDEALICTDKGENIMQCHIDKPVIEYDPLFDDLLLYDYKKAREISVYGSRADYINGKSFEQTINVVLTDGTTECATLPDGVSMKLVKLGSDAALVANSEENPEVMAISYPNIKFDMRLIDKADYEVQFLKDSKITCRATIGLHTSCTMPVLGQGAIGSDIAASQKEYFNSVLLNLADRQVEYPELYYLIQWFTQAKYNDNGTWKYATQKTWQRGVNMEAAVADLGIGLTQNNSFFDFWFELEAHKPCQLLTDENGLILTDEDGNFLID